MEHLNRITLAAAGGAGTMLGYVFILIVADQLGALDGLLEFLTGIVRAVCQ